MDEGLEHTRCEPLPRWGHVSVVIGSKLYLWGGRIEDFSEESKKEVSVMSTQHLVPTAQILNFGQYNKHNCNNVGKAALYYVTNASYSKM